jgi:hypothetical protein
MIASIYITYSELFDRQPTTSEIIEILRDLSMHHALHVLSFINLVVRSSLQEPNRQHFGQIQQQLIASHIDDEIFGRLQNRLPHVRCDERPIFLPHCVLNVLRLVLSFSCKDVPPDPKDDQKARYAIGRACLMMNNLLLTTEEEQRITACDESGINIELMVQSLTSFELTNPPSAHHLLLRLHVMFRTLLKNREICSRIALKCDGLDLSREFARTIGIPLERWLFVIFAIYAYFVHGGDALNPRPEFMLINPANFPGDSGMTAQELEAVLKTIGTTLADVESAIVTEGSTDPRYDFVPFRSKPLFAVEEGKLLPFDIAFILEKSHAGVLWTLHDSLPLKKRKKLFDAWGYLFEEYVHWLLGGMETNLSINYIPAPKWKKGGRRRKKNADESFDGLLLKDAVLMPMEYKGGFISRQARYSGNTDLFLHDLDKKFVPGCNQLATKIGVLFAEESIDRKELEGVPLEHIRAIVPVLVLQDHILRVPLLNWYLNKKFQEKLSHARLSPETCVRPLTVVNIQELESMVRSAEGADVNFIYALHNRTVRDNYMTSDLLEWLLQVPDFGKHQSPRMMRILDDLHGPMISYLFPKTGTK